MITPYQYKCVCSICGGEGFSHVRDAGLQWFGVEFYHQDPTVCRENLKSNRADNKEVVKPSGEAK